MHRVQLQPDTLDRENRRFKQAQLPGPVFLNSVPKSGSHLLQNILRMFVPLAQQYTVDFIQHANFDEHRRAFSADPPMLSWGHLPYSDQAALALHGVRNILLVRDPYDWVLARTRFMVSDQFSGPLDHLKSERLSPEQLMNFVIFGIWQKMPGLQEYFVHNAAAWLGTGVTLIHYEELSRAAKDPGSADGENFFGRLFEACGVSCPDDWAERIAIGADPAQSGTARANLSEPAISLPDELPATQRALVEVAAPGIRALLGYS